MLHPPGAEPAETWEATTGCCGDGNSHYVVCAVRAGSTANHTGAFERPTGFSPICDTPPCCATAAAAEMFHRPVPPCGFIKRFDHSGKYYLGNMFDDPVHGDWCSTHGMKFVVTAVDPCTTFSFFKNAESMASYCAPGNWAPGGDAIRSGLGCEYLPMAQRNPETCLSGTVSDVQLYNEPVNTEMLKVLLPGIGVVRGKIRFVRDATEAPTAATVPTGAPTREPTPGLFLLTALIPLTVGAVVLLWLWWAAYHRNRSAVDVEPSVKPALVRRGTQHEPLKKKKVDDGTAATAAAAAEAEPSAAEPVGPGALLPLLRRGLRGARAGARWTTVI